MANRVWKIETEAKGGPGYVAYILDDGTLETVSAPTMPPGRMEQLLAISMRVVEHCKGCETTKFLVKKV